jgi:hypothetical protein
MSDTASGANAVMNRGNKVFKLNGFDRFLMAEQKCTGPARAVSCLKESTGISKSSPF